MNQTTTTTKRPRGWHNGEYYCECGTTFGKSLRGESPHALVNQHLQECRRARGLFDMLAATHLPNGAQILSRRQTCADGWLALCRRNNEFVTWAVHADTGEAYWGHYFVDYDEAERDHERRVNMNSA